MNDLGSMNTRITKKVLQNEDSADENREIPTDGNQKDATHQDEPMSTELTANCRGRPPGSKYETH